MRFTSLFVLGFCAEGEVVNNGISEKGVHCQRKEVKEKEGDMAALKMIYKNRTSRKKSEDPSKLSIQLVGWRAQACRTNTAIKWSIRPF